jgi:methyltransferase family protein
MNRFANRLRNDASNRFRQTRFNSHIKPIINKIRAQKGSCSIVDIGGDYEYWLDFDLGSDVTVKLVNLKEPVPLEDKRFSSAFGDARNLDFQDNSFDLVHSNSLIEHVGLWSDMKRTAAEMRRLAPNYYVQTPNFWFPVDPHSRTAFIHWLPLHTRRKMLLKKPRGFYKKPGDLDAAMILVEGTSMLDELQMKNLFPDSKIVKEKVFGLTKSLIAIRC